MDFLTVELRIVEQAHCQDRILGVGHFDEAETAADTSLVANRERSTHLTGARKQRNQIDTRDRSGEIANVNFGHARLPLRHLEAVNNLSSAGVESHELSEGKFV